jgi:hypothetical protein
MVSAPTASGTLADLVESAVVCLIERLAHYSPDEARGLLGALQEDLAEDGLDVSWLAPAWHLTRPELWEAEPIDDAVMRSDAQFHRLVARAAQRPGFLAGVLLPYARAQGWDEADLAAELGCSLGSLPRLLLCHRPQALSGETDVATVAEAYGADPRALLRTLRAAAATAPTGDGAR